MADQDEERLFASLARDKLNRQLPLYAEERQEVLDEKSNHPDPYVRAAVAAHRDTPADALKRLMFDPEPVVVNALGSNWELPVEVARPLAEHGSDEVAASLAIKIHQDASVLEILSTRSAQARAHVAMNASCPEHVFRRLAHDESEFVRGAVAGNRKCPEDVLRQLASDGAVGVVIPLAHNDAAPPDLIASLRQQNPWLAEALDRRAEECDSQGPTEDQDDTANPGA